MSEAVELFLRRVIVDERIPFDIVALNTAQFNRLSAAHTKEESSVEGEQDARSKSQASRRVGGSRGERGKKRN